MERGKGLENVKHILRNNSKFDKLSDDSFHAIYESLFRVAVSEVSTYLKAKATTSRTAAENRLSACASSLRLAVEVAVRIVKLKTIRSVLSHITETLTLPGGKFCEPLALDYAKCLRAVLSYQPHVEHLSKPERERVISFCLKCIKTAEVEVEEDDTASGAEVISTGGTMNGLSYRSSRSHLKDSGGSQGNRSLAKHIAEEMIGCIALLTAAPNAASGKASEDLLWAVIEFLKKSMFTSSSHQDAFAAINHIIAWTRTENIELTRKAASPLVRLIRSHWSMKSASALKDEMLITLLYLEPYFIAVMQQDESFTLRSELSGMLEIMRNEYSQRQARDQLRIEDLRLEFDDRDSKQFNAISSPLFRLRSDNARAEANWATLYMLASFCHLLSNAEQADRSSDDEDERINQGPRKRPRLSDESDETLKHSTSGTPASRICALQTMAFLAQRKAFSAKQIAKIAEKLSLSCSEDNAAVSSWALLALAGFASQLTSTEPDPVLQSRWISIWQLVTRAMSNASTCRPACYLVQIMLLLRQVPQQAVSELVHTLSTAIDLNGPSALSDSVMHLLAYAVRTVQLTNPASSLDTAKSILSWLFRAYSPSRFEDKAYAIQHALFEPGDIVELVTCCLGQPNHYPNGLQYPIWDSVGHAWLACTEQHELITYLLLLPDSPSIVHSAANLQRKVKSPLQPRSGCEVMVLDHLISELYRAQEGWVQVTQDRPRGISIDMFSFFCSVCCVSTCIAFCNAFRDGRRQTQLQRQVRDLLKLLAGFIPSRECPPDKVDVMLRVLSSACSGLLDPSRTVSSECEDLICSTVFSSMEARNNARGSNGMDEDDDAMEIDGAYDSQDSRRGNTGSASHDLKSDSAVNFSTFSLRSSVPMYAAAISMQHQASSGNGSASASQSIVDCILALEEPSILANRHVISSLSDLGVELTESDTYRLLDVFSDTILAAYPYERSEVATGAILDIASSLVPAWTNRENKPLFELGSDMYAWYTTTALSGGVLSPNVQKRVATLLMRLCHVDVDYPWEEDVDSVRTSLFKLLQQGSISVQFHLANRISTIFGLFVLSNHPAMFNDLQSSLPADSEWIEGMAMRLLFLAKLGSAWHSLLRQCVYYIFETAGQVPKAGRHAKRSIAELAASLKFESPQKLFNLFASQLLHTWLERNQVESLPFDIFEYESLEALIADNRDEITAQLLIRGNDEGMHTVMKALKATSRDLVVQSFAKCLAYSICWDISRPPAKPSDDSSESRLRKLAGNSDYFKSLINDRFPTVMGYFYLASTQDDVEDKWLDKKDAYKSAARALAEMKSFSCSDKMLPPGQQPSFKSKYLCDQIGRLCRRTSHDPTKPWSPSSFATAARMLLDSISPALGPLHTCLVIRKLRILISMSGDVPFYGFPLEMLVHALRSFLNDSQCADDAIGILQYLLHYGQMYLKTDLPFLCGTVTLMILQMRKHSAGRQESTTQESQHQMTVQKMQAFQSWLVKYMQKCEPSDSSVQQKYASMVKALAQANRPGNARKGSPESGLLLILLEESISSGRLLRQADRDEAMHLLAENFEAPSSITEDCLDDDDECARYAHSIWGIIKIPHLNEAFVTWAASALGRAYAHTGIRPLGPSDASQRIDEIDVMKFEGVARSQATIARSLCDSLLSKDRSQASIADYTLRQVVFSFRDAEEAVRFEQMLPSPIVPVIGGGTFGYEPRLAKTTATKLANVRTLQSLMEPNSHMTMEAWVQGLSVTLCQRGADVAILPALITALQHSSGLALELLPSIVHILLTKDLDKGQVLRSELSSAFAVYLSDDSDALLSKQRYLMQLLLYLRSQALPGESTNADRLRWLDVDWLLAAQAANRCQIPHTALLFTESISQPTHGGRRASSRASLSQVGIEQIPQDLLLSIFKAVEEPDSFYGVEQPATLGSVLDRLDYEADGHRSLMFRSAQTDTDLRRSHGLANLDGTGMVRSLSMLNLNSLTFALLSRGFGTADASEELLNSARRLQQWDIMPPETISQAASSSFTALQELSRATDHQLMDSKLKSIMLDHSRPMTSLDRAENPPHEWFSALASLAEADELLSRQGGQALPSTRNRMIQRQTWMRMARYCDFRAILSNRNALFGLIAQNGAVSSGLRIGVKECRSIEIDSLLSASRLAREHGQLQEAIGATTQIADLLGECQDIELKADVVAKSETASVLWASGEVTASVQMLRDALAVPDFESQDLPAGRSGLLAQLAHQLAEARLEKPEDILSDYLNPAISHLQSQHEGEEAGKVFHEFATFCDKQLQNPGNVEDLNRITKLRQRKLEEVEELQRLAKAAKNSGVEKQDYTRDLGKAKQWFQMDDADYKRLKQSRDTFMEQSLQNYLQALRASDEHDISVLRFFALWLENSDVAAANAVVSKFLQHVPSWKFVVLMNQLMSRLETDNSVFQSSLKSLATRICSEHPHHSLHHLFATTRRPSGKDVAAQSRFEVGMSIRKHVSAEPKRGELLKNIFLANNCYNGVATDEAKGAKGSQVSIKELKTTVTMASRVPELRVPPPTIDIPLHRDGEYDNVPVVTKFGQSVRFMSGLSRPKRITALASDGQQYVQLFKGGNDDLRQDTIMEQVFDEASKMLRNHKTARQRNLHIRTYKVIPLSPKSGIIEFVPNSTSFSDFLVPAHERYYPQDYKYNQARSKIQEAKEHSIDTRVKAYRKVCEHLQPVMRHFFFERYDNPDEWFAKRTAYTRTTAAVSILGHVLGLGDRHCQNIMLDEKTGEVVHIDLGVAFEAGKVLPVPELVPFRLTRDVVDGMGITKTEGVFRRCCELTLDALREDKDSIMTLLNVLRYDPLYTWTVSPLKAKRMQQDTGRNAGDADAPEGSSKKREEEAGEADRALSTVEKKLSQTLSTAATVSELIQQATDERNLATLFSGWSAFF